jgi:hypothetical protein
MSARDYDFKRPDDIRVGTDEIDEDYKDEDFTQTS